MFTKKHVTSGAEKMIKKATKKIKDIQKLIDKAYAVVDEIELHDAEYYESLDDLLDVLVGFRDYHQQEATNMSNILEDYGY